MFFFTWTLKPFQPHSLNNNIIIITPSGCSYNLYCKDPGAFSFSYTKVQSGFKAKIGTRLSTVLSAKSSPDVDHKRKKKNCCHLSLMHLATTVKSSLKTNIRSLSQDFACMYTFAFPFTLIAAINKSRADDDKTGFVIA